MCEEYGPEAYNPEESEAAGSQNLLTPNSANLDSEKLALINKLYQDAL